MQSRFKTNVESDLWPDSAYWDRLSLSTLFFSPLSSCLGSKVLPSVLATPHAMLDLTSLTRDQTHTSCNESMVPSSDLTHSFKVRLKLNTSWPLPSAPEGWVSQSLFWDPAVPRQHGLVLLYPSLSVSLTIMVSSLKAKSMCFSPHALRTPAQSLGSRKRVVSIY